MRHKIALLLCVIVLSAFVYAIEEKQYATQLAPGELYFVKNVMTNGLSHTYTNNESFMWYPAKVKVIFGQIVTNKLTITHLVNVTEQQFLESKIVTNEFGNVQTNWLHQLTNTVTHCYTNVLYEGSYTGTTKDVTTLTDDYIQRGDVYKVTVTTNDSFMLSIIGKR